MHKGLTRTGLSRPFSLISSSIIACLLLTGNAAFAATTTEDSLQTTLKLQQSDRFTNEFVGLDFRLNKEKEGVIIVKLASSASAVDIKKDHKGLNIELIKTKVSDDNLYVIDVKDFSTPVSTVEVFRHDENTRLQASISNEFTYDYRLKGKLLEITITEVKEKEISNTPKQQSVIRTSSFGHRVK